MEDKFLITFKSEIRKIFQARKIEIPKSIFKKDLFNGMIR